MSRIGSDPPAPPLVHSASMTDLARPSPPSVPETLAPARSRRRRRRPARVLLACALAAAAGPARGDAEGAGREEDALVEAVSRTPAADIPALVAGDPRFAALDTGARLRLVEAVRPPAWRRVLASALNVYPSFGVGSLVQGDWQGAAIAAGIEAAGGLLVVAGAWASDGGAITPATALLATAGFVTIGMGIGYGVMRPWRWEGRRPAALRRALFPPPSPTPVSPAAFAPAPPAGGVIFPVVALRF